MQIQQFEIVGTQSHIDWVVRKVTGAHNGTIVIDIPSTAKAV